jgi:hypothetical protein
MYFIYRVRDLDEHTVDRDTGFYNLLSNCKDPGTKTSRTAITDENIFWNGLINFIYVNYFTMIHPW